MVENGRCGGAVAERGKVGTAVGAGFRLVRYRPDGRGTGGGRWLSSETGHSARSCGHAASCGAGAAYSRDFGMEGLRRLWMRLVEDDLVRVVFHDGGVTDFAGFAYLLAPERAWVYRIEMDGTVQGFFWCNGFSGKAAQVHFCFFRAGMSVARAAGRMALTFLLAPQRADAPLDTLLGVTPAPFRHALRLAADLGFTRIGVVPAGTRLAPGTPGGGGAGRVVDVVLTVMTRETLRGVAAP